MNLQYSEYNGTKRDMGGRLWDEKTATDPVFGDNTQGF